MAKANKRGKKKEVEAKATPRLNVREFVELWQKCSSNHDVEATWPGRFTTMAARAKSLRERGVKLKDFGRRPRGGIDVESLNELAAKSSS